LRRQTGYGDPVVTKRRRRSHEEVVAAEEGEREANAVAVYRGEPFRPASDVAVADPDRFAPPVLEPPFVLDDEKRKQLLYGDTYPVISFPKDEMPSVSEGEVVEVTSQVAIVVLGFHPTVTHQLLRYNVIDRRTDRIRSKSRQRVEPSDISTLNTLDPLGRKDGATEYEPEPLTRKEATAMAKMTRADEIRSLRQSRETMMRNLEKLEGSPGCSEICWNLRRVGTQLNERIERLRRLDREEKAA
jgi:hypothetical protein